MPLYDHECSACSHIFEEIKKYEERIAECPKCGAFATRIVSSMRRSQIDIFEPKFIENIDTDPIWIESKKQLADECEKRGLYSKYLDTGYKHHGRKRWI